MATSELSALVGTVDITPSYPVSTPKCRNPERGLATSPTDGEDSWAGLEVNYALLTAGAGTVVALVSIDTLFAGELGPRVESLLKERACGLELIFYASHTHYSPQLDSRLAAMSYEQGYVEEVSQLLSETLANASRRLQAGEGKAVRIRNGSAPSTYAMSRRRKVWFLDRRGRRLRNEFRNIPNSQGTTDPAIRVLQAETADGEVVFFGWSFACHPVTYPDLATVTSEFPGYVRNEIRSKLGSIPVLFFAGCAGDQRPSVARPVSLSERIFCGIRMRVGWHGWRDPSRSAWEHWCLDLSRCALDVREQSATLDPGTPLSVSKQSRILDNDRHGRVLTVTAVSLGSLRLVSFNAEPVAEYAHLVQSALDGDVWPIGYEGQVFGYLPTTEMLSEGGYEVAGHFPMFERDELGIDDPTKVVTELLHAMV